MPGTPGDKGDIGLTGPIGIPGEPGAPGVRGEKGDRGEPGLSIKGEIGPRGEQGAKGAPGERGTDGMLPLVRAWQSGVNYKHNVVVHDGGTFQALKDTAEVPGAGSDWACLARAGRDGAGPQVRGLFDEKTADYRALDIVVLNGGSFIAKRDNPGKCPGDGWQMIAKQGKQGDKGEPGVKGDRGAVGVRGEKGTDAPVIKRWQIDRTAFVAVPVMSDGSDGPPLQLRSLFEQFQIEAGHG